VDQSIGIIGPELSVVLNPVAETFRRIHPFSET
jgi:hypothetical protein